MRTDLEAFPLTRILYRSEMYLFMGPVFFPTLILVTPRPRGHTDFD